MARPHILVLMVDQLAGTLFPDGPADFLHAPNLRALAARSARFAAASTPCPLCSPARAAFMTGRLPSGLGIYDNACEFSAEIPTFAHHLRRVGYFTCLAGKMHFVGPDQLHGFEERLTTDIYPADFGWTPDYRRPGERVDWWYHTLGSVTGAGVAEITNQLDYDDEVTHRAEAKLYDLARGRDARPWCLTVSLTHPHDPYVARRRFWDLYADCPALDPEIPPIEPGALDPHSLRLLAAADADAYEITAEQVRRARRGYFANISYVDEQIGRLLDTLARCGMAEETAILFTSDHGDMLGEGGLWFKMSPREGSIRVPLMLAGPGIAAGSVPTPVSLLDVAPTLAELGGAGDVAHWVEGESLIGIAAGASRGPVPAEYAGEGTVAPLIAVRDGRFKLVLCAADPPMLFDLAADPAEALNLAADPAQGATLARLTGLALGRWDPAGFDAAVRESQARRLLVYEALRQGSFTPWDHEPRRPASEAYMRNHMDLNVLEEERRWPRGG